MSQYSAKTCEARRKDIFEKLDTKLATKTFNWAFGILIGILMAIFSFIWATVNDNSRSSYVTEGDIKAIKNDTAWIKATLEDLKK